MRKYFLRQGFTLIELVMVILLLSVLAAVAIPNFIDFRTDAKNASTQGALGGMRSALSIIRAAISLRESPATPTPTYPTAAELQKNSLLADHPILSGTSIMDPTSGIPRNPWTNSTMGIAFHSSVLDCTGNAKGTLGDARGFGWCYEENQGQIWANSKNNGFPATKVESYY